MIIFLPISLNICFGCSDRSLSTHNICFGWEIKIIFLEACIGFFEWSKFHRRNRKTFSSLQFCVHYMSKLMRLWYIEHSIAYSHSLNMRVQLWKWSLSLSPFPASHDFCGLLLLQLMFSGSWNCKQNGPWSDCSQRSSLIRFHSVCFHGKI